VVVQFSNRITSDVWGGAYALRHTSTSARFRPPALFRPLTFYVKLGLTVNKARNSEHLSIGERIALARDEYRLSQAQLGANLGVTRAAVSQYEQDRIRPRPKVFDRLAELFNSDPEWFERGRGRAPDALDAPVDILEINVERLTGQTGALRDLHGGRRWRLPIATFPGIQLAPDHTVAITAPNDAGPILAGDRVLVDGRRCEGDGVFLVVDAEGPRLAMTTVNYDRVLGRAIAYLRTL
jgi:transcriptional regulator with XRE-family HTH domain